ncbi:hypothetical protein Patl1_34754 [Pistacia atlantica]|uniref:Uncharacterized protein n=1 Tax=Pistacia atlantica TaxID=434234 RepID=A0ACC0ZQS4_9ROSI|nr:hypothetical protein Patl1_34754 [Pistacia atlantica]
MHIWYGMEINSPSVSMTYILFMDSEFDSKLLFSFRTGHCFCISFSLNNAYGFWLWSKCDHGYYDFYSWNHAKECRRKPEGKLNRKGCFVFSTSPWSMFVFCGHNFASEGKPSQRIYFASRVAFNMFSVCCVDDYHTLLNVRLFSLHILQPYPMFLVDCKASNRNSPSASCFSFVGDLTFMNIYQLAAYCGTKVLECLKESCILLLDITFGISINIMRIKRASSKRSSIEESLLSVDIDVEEGSKVSGNNQSYWDPTFESINSMMNRGVIKQLEFEDLLGLPVDMDPSACHYKLLSCWETQDSSNSSNPSLLRAICCAYGYPYLCLGLLKVLNDCIGFAGPLLLNRLIKFLQQGSGNLDGYVLAIALGLTSIFK